MTESPSSADPPPPAERPFRPLQACATNLAATCIERLAEGGARAAVVELDAAGDVERSFTCAELLERAARWAERFDAAGLEPDDHIAVCPSRDLDLAAIHLAALAGAVPLVPLNASLTPAEVTTLLLDSRPTLVISEPEFAVRNVEAAEALQRPWWVTAEPNGGLQPPFALAPLADTDPDSATTARPVALRAVEVGEHHEAMILYTSGTTGRPKSVPLTHANLRSNLETLAALWGRDTDDRLLHMLPAHHLHGLVLGMYGTLMAAGTCLMLPRFDARAAIDVVSRGDANLVMGVPTMYARILAAARGGDDLSSLRLALCGSAPLSIDVWDRFKSLFGVELVERYGLTETGILTTNPIDRPRPGSAGKVLPGTKLVIRDADRYVRPVEGRKSPRGEICVAGASVTTGYGNDPDATVVAFHDELFHTGDLGHVDEDGYLWLDGRLKDLIIVGGSNVVPAEVERALSWVNGVAELAVCGLPDADLGEIVAAYVVADTTAGEQSQIEASLRKAADDGLASYKCPRRYFFVDELPRNAMGKIDRGKLCAAA